MQGGGASILVSNTSIHTRSGCPRLSLFSGRGVARSFV